MGINVMQRLWVVLRGRKNHLRISDSNCSLLLPEQTALQCFRKSTLYIVNYLSSVKNSSCYVLLDLHEVKEGRVLVCYSVTLKYNVGNNYILLKLLGLFLMPTGDSTPLKFSQVCVNPDRWRERVYSSQFALFFLFLFLPVVIELPCFV